MAQDAAEPPATVEEEEIIVLGEKTERSLQDTVSSVAVTTAERIEEENIQSLHDVINRTPNVSQTYGRTGFTIRGISEAGLSGGNGGLATVYVDGAALPRDSLFSGPLNMWDVAQVEILRGPQSTLQGRNALAGAITVRSEDPTWDWSARGRTILSDADDRSFAFAGGGPLIDDVLAFRVAFEDRHSDGFIYNPTRGEDADPSDVQVGRLKFLFTPLDDLTFRATYTHTESEQAYMFMYADTSNPDYWDNRYNYADTRDFTDNISDFVTLEGVYDLSDTLSLTSVTAWSRVDDLNGYDGDLTAAPLSFGTSATLTETLTQELRLNYDGPRLDGLIGVYFSNQDIENQSQSLTLVPTPVETIAGLLTGFGFSDPDALFIANLYGAALPVIPVDFSSTAPSQVETIALFGDATFALTDRLSLLAGFRYDREDYTVESLQQTNFVGALPDPAAAELMQPGLGFVFDQLNMAVLGFVASANGSAPQSTVEFEAFLPKLGLSYDWTDDITTSFVVQRGYRSGGSSINLARSSVVPYDPEFTWNYEFSFRSLWANRRLMLNANAFYIDWTDQQVSINLGLNDYDYQTENAGKSHLYGFEVELGYRPTDALDIYAALGYTRTEFDEFLIQGGGITPDQDLAGTEFHYAPHWTLSAGGTYHWANGLMWNVNANYRGEAFADIGENQQTWAIDARTVVNTKFGYDGERFGAYIFANNLFNEHFVQYPVWAENRAVLGDPRVLGIILEARF